MSLFTGAVCHATAPPTPLKPLGHQRYLRFPPFFLFSLTIRYSSIFFPRVQALQRGRCQFRLRSPCVVYFLLALSPLTHLNRLPLLGDRSSASAARLKSTHKTPQPGLYIEARVEAGAACWFSATLTQSWTVSAAETTSTRPSTATSRIMRGSKPSASPQQTRGRNKHFSNSRWARL